MRFVPLIGEEGWKDGLTPRSDRRAAADRRMPPNRCPTSTIPAFGAMFDRFGDARVVLLGEASHGTSEFYRARAAISRRLIERARVQHRRGRGRLAGRRDDRPLRAAPAGAGPQFKAFERFPTWMWRNTEVDAFIRWMRRHNAAPRAPGKSRVLRPRPLQPRGSMQAVIDYLDEHDPELARLAHKRYGCLEPWADNPQMYGQISLLEGYARCEVGVDADAAGPAPAARRLLRRRSATNGSTRRPTRGW